MRAVYVTRTFDRQTGLPGEVAVLEVDKPRVVADDDVLIEVAYAALCGSDAHFISDDLFDFPVPFPAGHEFSGVIEDLGSAAAAKGFARGDKVTGDFVLECGRCEACRSGRRQFCAEVFVNGSAQAEYILLKADQVYHIPEKVSLLEGALFEPFVIAAGAMDKARLQLGQSMLIVGAGSIGQMLVQLARSCGAALVAASARTASKRELALRLGADVAIDPQHEDIRLRTAELTGQGFDVVIEASGSSAAAAEALDLVAPGGTVVLMSYYPPGQSIEVDLFRQIVTREVTVTGLQLSQNNWHRAQKMFARIDVKPIISKVYPLSEAPQAYADLVSGGQLKIVLDCGGGAS